MKNLVYPFTYNRLIIVLIIFSTPALGNIRRWWRQKNNKFIHYLLSEDRFKFLGFKLHCIWLSEIILKDF